MATSYEGLALRGYAHSVEVWSGSALIGGLYGVALGRMFYGESMFSRRPGASKIALVYLARQLEEWGFELIDCQVFTTHLASLGASTIPRTVFVSDRRPPGQGAGRSVTMDPDPEPFGNGTGKDEQRRSRG